MSTNETLKNFGFYRTQIEYLLKGRGISIALSGEGASPAPKPPEFPEWKRMLALSSSLSMDEVVSALIGIDPYEDALLSGDANANYRRYSELIGKAIEHGEIAAKEGRDSRGNTCWKIDARSLASWFMHKGLEYPLPLPPSPASVNPAGQSKQTELQDTARWPWGNYTTKAMEILADAAKQWWSTYDLGNPGTAPTNNEVAKYLTGKGVSPNLAYAMATILRADDLPTGRRKSGQS